MKILRILALLALALSLSCDPEPTKAAQPIVITVQSRIPKMLEFVKKSNPAISESDALFIARTLEDKASEYDLDLATFAAVIRQESHFRLNLKVCRPKCGYGLGQISPPWIKTWKLDPLRLQYDVGYNLDVSARILKLLQIKYPADKMAYSRYHNAKPTLRKDYEKRVEKWKTLALR